MEVYSFLSTFMSLFDSTAFLFFSVLLGLSFLILLYGVTIVETPSKLRQSLYPKIAKINEGVSVGIKLKEFLFGK